MSTSTQKNACCTYDFTFFPKEEKDDHEWIITTLKNHCKSWSFQKEKGTETQKEHYQGRFSLKTKKRIANIPFTLGHYSITSKENRTNDFYVTKEDTRIEGPWSDKDTITYIPKQVREITSLYPWQQEIIDKAQEWDTRTINIVVCPNGNVGKSTLCSYMRAHSLGTPLPPINDYKDLLRMVYARAKDSGNCFLIDQPKSQNKDKLYGFYSAVETAKDGYAYDDRYSFKERIFDCPNIWVFTNTRPDINLLSRDRWCIWEIHNKHLAKVCK